MLGQVKLLEPKLSTALEAQGNAAWVLIVAAITFLSSFYLKKNRGYSWGTKGVDSEHKKMDTVVWGDKNVGNPTLLLGVSAGSSKIWHLFWKF